MTQKLWSSSSDDRQKYFSRREGKRFLASLVDMFKQSREQVSVPSVISFSVLGKYIKNLFELVMPVTTFSVSRFSVDNNSRSSKVWRLLCCIGQHFLKTTRVCVDRKKERERERNERSSGGMLNCVPHHQLPTAVWCAW